MNKFLNIAVAIGVSALLTTNLYLLFSEKTILPKTVFVNEYERVVADDFNEKLPKEAFIETMDTYTVYAGSDDTVETWLVTEGDDIFAGDELATLNTERADGQRNMWETERTSLQQQETDISNLLSELENESSNATSNVSSKVDNRSNNVSEGNGNTPVEFELDVDFTVDVTQEGAYAQAIAAAKQQLSDISRQLVVVDAQLGQDSARPSIISPVDGVVANVIRRGSTLSIDIYSKEKVVKTYAKDHEWQQIEIGDRVLLQAEGVESEEEGSVLSVSEIPTIHEDSLEAYKKLDPKLAVNPLAYYEVRISTEADIFDLPYGNHMHAAVITNEAFGAVSVNEKWLRVTDEKVVGMIIDQSGSAVKIPVTTPFTLGKRAVVTEGISNGDIVVDESDLRKYVQPPKVFISMPTNVPKKADWRQFGWRNYLKHFFIE